MEQQSQEQKIPIPRLPCSSQRKFRQCKSLSTKLAERRQRSQTRVYIGVSLKRWRELRKTKRFRSDEAVATFLMDCQEFQSEASTSTAPVPVAALSNVHGVSSERNEDSEGVVIKEQGLTHVAIPEKINYVEYNHSHTERSLSEWPDDEPWSPSQAQVVSSDEEQ